ncbi:MAG: class I SAM-dependent methyltransferase, partial [Anaerolineae bacterium]|nr:class I SAM-dependent methyltransferase [Anaerolineae bacterium]
MDLLINRVASNLVQAEDGLWLSRDQSAVSYPAEGMDFTYRLEERSYWFLHRNRCIISLVNRFRPSGPLFDIGGGNGFVSQGLRQAGLESIVVEPDPVGSRHALVRSLKPVIAATLNDAGFYQHSLPAVGLFDVLEHIQDDRALLLQLHDLLTADGHLY